MSMDGSFRYWRLRNTKERVGYAGDNDFRWVLHRIKFVGADKQVLCAPQTEGSPGTAICGGFIVFKPARRAFEDNDNHWSGRKERNAGEYIGYDFKTPVAVRGFQLKQYPRYDTKEVAVEASNDGQDWVLVATQGVECRLKSYVVEAPASLADDMESAMDKDVQRVQRVLRVDDTLITIILRTEWGEQEMRVAETEFVDEAVLAALGTSSFPKVSFQDDLVPKGMTFKEFGIEDGAKLSVLSVGKPQRSVSMIHGMAGWFIDMIELKDSSGEILDKIGSPGGGDREVFQLEDDEYLVKIEYKNRGAYSGSSMCLSTDKGRRYGVVGTHEYESGEQFVFEAQPGNHIVGFKKTGRAMTGIVEESTGNAGVCVETLELCGDVSNEQWGGQTETYRSS